MTTAPQTVHALLDTGAADAVAIAATERPPLTFGALRQLVRDTVVSLNQLGYGRGDAVAIVLPNGPEMATSFIAVASACVSAPLNPAYVDDELDFYLSDLKAKALLVEAGSDSPAVTVANKLGIPIVELVADKSGPSGTFTLRGPDGQDIVPDPARAPDLAQPDDVGLILHTSGTTSRPKQVPLRQKNLAASARHIGATLKLTPNDRCMNIMPLFHIHGLIAATLSSLAAGGSVFCTPGFNALRFFALLDEANPTWYTAVPTMHQAILTRADRNAEIIAKHPLRLIRSSSASLPPQVMAALESTFSAPVIEAYGMTEAAHQMASNPLPPRARKPGSVGVAAGPEVSIMNDEGELLGPSETGEVVIQGPNVTAGYVNNEKANADAFTNGWFRTGDQGYLDNEGYLWLTGRLKEIINRGGEKISPREIDEVLLDHPSVAQVCTFAMPHEKLGEEVAAAVVLIEGIPATERELRDFCAGRLADFKVPRKVVILPEIPKGATGKIQRIGLAEKLGLGK
ncbi:MAG: AMP-binding protein [Chloroflexi bacterium]|nr:AMP-binding protein [Chloroflexota bacterium]